jgi:hypothetical protein
MRKPQQEAALPEFSDEELAQAVAAHTREFGGARGTAMDRYEDGMSGIAHAPIGYPFTTFIGDQ